jgi:hypothetical protein
MTRTGCRLYAATTALVLLVLCSSTTAQELERTVRSPEDVQRLHTQRLSDLASQNLNRVAASASDIQQVLVTDPGLFVELRRVIAKEATDNGQVVQDSDLTEQVIFDRLARDVAFRSVATRLLQRYGYLLPALNPDSDLGKQQELVLKERARQLVQIEAQEDSRAMNPQRQARDREEMTGCDLRTDTSCQPSVTDTSRRPAGPARAPDGSAPPATPGEMTPPDQETPLGPALNQSRILRAAAQGRQDGLSDGDSISSSLRNADFAQASNRSGLGSMNGLAPTISSIPAGMPTDGLLPSENRERILPSTNGTTPNAERAGVSARNTPRGPGESELSPVAMVRTANPYSDIPSLFDMYVQTSSRQKKPELFGIDVFRNSFADASAIPMDLPVDPDYVVGPGDALAIDLWGGVSQRLFRVVDREGRVSLPEVGPVLVSGKSLSSLQQ